MEMCMLQYALYVSDTSVCATFVTADLNTTATACNDDRFPFYSICHLLKLLNLYRNCIACCDSTQKVHTAILLQQHIPQNR